MEKTLHNSDVSGARKDVPDIKVVGNGDTFRLFCETHQQSYKYYCSGCALGAPAAHPPTEETK